VPVTRIGLEAGPLSQWLHAGLSEARLGREPDVVGHLEEAKILRAGIQERLADAR
jgi:hypothetical protein